MIYKGDYKITSPYGPRNLNGDTRPHKGADFVGLQGKEIIAPCDGIIQRSTIITDKNNPTWEWGNYVRLDTEDKHLLYFCHLSKRLVSVGQKIKKGEIIGLEGNTGYSFGSHCHFEVRTAANASIDPIAYLNSINKKDKTFTYQEAVNFIKSEVALSDETMTYLKSYKYDKNLIPKIAKLIYDKPLKGEPLLDDYISQFKQVTGFEDKTIEYLSADFKYGKDLINKLLKAMI